jgi:hypothetical protein
VHFYWCAKAPGFEPRTVRLHYPDTPEGHVDMQARCRVLQASMLEWAAGHPQGRPLAPAGTVAWIVDRYQTDEDSPYRDVRPSTRKSYDESLAIIRKSVGERRLSAVDGRDVRRWHKGWGRHDEATGELRNPRRAYGCIQLLRIVCAYGTSLRNADCRDLRDVLAAMQFEGVAKRKTRMTYEQAKAFVAAAHDLGHPAMALAVALQFELGLRQRDVIGEWVDGEGRSGIVDGPERQARRAIYASRNRVAWATGLTWSHIDADMILRKPTSKSNGTQVAEHDLRRHPDVLAELALVPADRRVGPVVVNPSSGLPFKRREFARVFRRIATAAGIPADVWNMDSRAGAISEGYEAGADLADMMKMATQTRVETSMRYNRGGVEQTNRVADLRAERRKRT